ncbi:hypothetical protein, partial [Candidatus Mycobacterium methanotrophicum]|uniref:hypothetical protein n=1 Tax=Candidatus Mycobacterium methanotrophicum TaxID=2943498 RepID=UPI001C5880D3
IPQHRKLGPPDTLPLHPQTAGRNPDFMLIARSKSKSPHIPSIAVSNLASLPHQREVVLAARRCGISRQCRVY